MKPSRSQWLETLTLAEEIERSSLSSQDRIRANARAIAKTARTMLLRNVRPSDVSDYNFPAESLWHSGILVNGDSFRVLVEPTETLGNALARQGLDPREAFGWSYSTNDQSYEATREVATR